MNNEIKEILDRLERIDHKEYSCGFEFADSGSFYEDGRCFEERKKMANYITNLQQENKKQKEAINKANKKLNNFIECCKAEKLESGSDYIHHQYWDMFERFNKQIKDILKEVSE